MTLPTTHQFNPELDLWFERVVDVPQDLVWQAWTTPDQITQWFTPAPWKTIACEIDLRPGGMFSFTMQSPEGQDFPGVSCYLEIIKNEKLVWTNALSPGYRPAKQAEPYPDHPCEEFVFTAVISLEPHANGTKYTALVMHADSASRIKHEQMGFHDGWGAALDQLVAMIKDRRAK